MNVETATVRDKPSIAVLPFESRGTTELRGVPGEQELFSTRA